MPGMIPLGRFRIEYIDGNTEEVRSNFGAIMELEKELPDPDTPSGTALSYGMWLFKGRPGGDVVEWARTVYNIEPVAVDADPSLPVAGDV